MDGKLRKKCQKGDSHRTKSHKSCICHLNPCLTPNLCMIEEDFSGDMAENRAVNSPLFK